MSQDLEQRLAESEEQVKTLQKIFRDLNHFTFASTYFDLHNFTSIYSDLHHFTSIHLHHFTPIYIDLHHFSSIHFDLQDFGSISLWFAPL